jgi:hypothetical protein
MSRREDSTTSLFFSLQDETDAWFVALAPELRVDGREVEVHLPGILRLEGARLQLDHDEAAELEVEEEQVEVEVLAGDGEVHLAADEGEADAELEEEVAYVVNEPPLEVTLLRIRGERHEVEDVGVLRMRSVCPVPDEVREPS